MHGYLDSADLSGFDDDNEDESEWRLSRPSCTLLWADPTSSRECYSVEGLSAKWLH